MKTNDELEEFYASGFNLPVTTVESLELYASEEKVNIMKHSAAGNWLSKYENLIRRT